MRKIIFTTAILSSLATCVSFARTTPMGDSILRLNAAVKLISNNSELRIKRVSINNDGTAKVELADSSNVCRAVIYSFRLGANDGDYIAVNPQRALCQ
jgi:hypothetical protein